MALSGAACRRYPVSAVAGWGTDAPGSLPNPTSAGSSSEPPLRLDPLYTDRGDSLFNAVLAERARALVDSSPGPGACWPWTGKKARHGYGLLPVYIGGRKTVLFTATRVLWEIENGPIPDGHEVCHTCDNPPCCNLEHLFIGTRSDNVRDALAKGRFTQNQILVPEEVREVRAMYAAGISIATIADRYHMAKVSIDNIVHDRKWKWID